MTYLDFKNDLKKTALYSAIANYRTDLNNRAVINLWNKEGRPVPPPAAYKRSTIKEYSNKYRINALIETGTFRGDTVSELCYHFKKIVSIELDWKLYSTAVQRFANQKNVTIIFGDSGEVLPGIVESISEPHVFWLDGHYSEGITALGRLNTPIMDELECISKNLVFGHVILIDDARLFVGKDDYPTLDVLEKMVLEKFQTMQFDVKDDIIRIFPK